MSQRRRVRFKAEGGVLREKSQHLVWGGDRVRQDECSVREAFSPRHPSERFPLVREELALEQRRIREVMTALQGYGPTSIHRRSWVFMDGLVWSGLHRPKPDVISTDEICHPRVCLQE